MNAIPVTNLVNKPCYSDFDASDWDILSLHWYPVARIEDVSTTPQQVTLLDVKMALYQTESGDIHLVRDICPHRGVPLTKGWVEGEEIVCPYHGLRYNSEGKCTKTDSIKDQFLKLHFWLVNNIMQYIAHWHFFHFQFEPYPDDPLHPDILVLNMHHTSPFHKTRE